MKTYDVAVTVTLMKMVRITASSKKEAKEKAEEMYHEDEITLDGNDFDGLQCSAYEVRNG